MGPAAETVIVVTKSAVHLLSSAKKSARRRTSLLAYLRKGPALSNRAEQCLLHASPAGHGSALCRRTPGQLMTAPCCVVHSAALVAACAEACKERVGVELVTHVKPKGEDGAAQIAELIAAVEGSGDSPVLGLLLKVKCRRESMLQSAVCIPTPHG